MKYIIFAMLPLSLSFTTAAQVETPSTKKKEATTDLPAADKNKTISPIQASISEYRAKITQLRKELTTIPTQENRIEYYNNHKPDSAPYREKVITLLEKDPLQKHAEIGLVWILKLGTRKEIARVKPIIYKQYKESDSMGMYVYWLYKAGNKNLAEIEAISASTKNINIRENANFYAAQIYKTYLTLDRFSNKEKEVYKKKSTQLLNSIMDSPTLKKRNPKLHDLCKKSLDALLSNDSAGATTEP